MADRELDLGSDTPPEIEKWAREELPKWKDRHVGNLGTAYTIWQQGIQQVFNTCMTALLVLKAMPTNCRFMFPIEEVVASDAVRLFRLLAQAETDRYEHVLRKELEKSGSLKHIPGAFSWQFVHARAGGALLVGAQLLFDREKIEAAGGWKKKS